jgi:hypothetical protein
MLRYTIRDILWLTAVVSILSLWAVERGAVDAIDYWSGNRENQDRMSKIIEQQALTIEQLNAALQH